MIKVGDIVRVVESSPKWMGLECEVVGGLEYRRCSDTKRYEPTLIVDVPGKGPHIARPHQVRKVEPPREDQQIVRWAECPWQPASVKT